jgi:hypothetical protein
MGGVAADREEASGEESGGMGWRRDSRLSGLRVDSGGAGEVRPAPAGHPAAQLPPLATIPAPSSGPGLELARKRFGPAVRPGPEPVDADSEALGNCPNWPADPVGHGCATDSDKGSPAGGRHNRPLLVRRVGVGCEQLRMQPAQAREEPRTALSAVISVLSLHCGSSKAVCTRTALHEPGMHDSRSALGTPY